MIASRRRGCVVKLTPERDRRRERRERSGSSSPAFTGIGHAEGSIHSWANQLRTNDDAPIRDGEHRSAISVGFSARTTGEPERVPAPCSQRVHPTAGALGQRGPDGRQVLAPPLGRGHGRGQLGSLPPAVLGGRGREGGPDPSTASPLSISTEGSCAGASSAFSVSSSSSSAVSTSWGSGRMSR
jgi:hypothetical protein